MKHLLRNFLIHLVTLLIVSTLLGGFVIEGGARTLVVGTLALMVINVAVVPLLKVMFLPLNILTLGIFTWAINVVGLYILTTVVPQIKLLPYIFEGVTIGWLQIPAANLNVWQVAIVASFLIGLISHFLQWLYNHH